MKNPYLSMLSGLGFVVLYFGLVILIFWSLLSVAELVTR